MVDFWRTKVNSKKSLDLWIAVLCSGFSFLLVTAVAEAFGCTNYSFEHNVRAGKSKNQQFCNFKHHCVVKSSK